MNGLFYRKGSIYVDMAFTYDSAKLSGSDAMYAVHMAVQNGTVYKLQVENYFMYRGGISQVHNGIQLLTFSIDVSISHYQMNKIVNAANSD
jgi:hypothetical protein